MWKQSNIKILDIGTGQGLFPILCKDAGFDVYATEINKEECDYLLSKRNINCLFGYLTDLKIPSNSFDVVTAWHVLEHHLNPLETINEIHKILIFGGVCVVAMPNANSLENYFRLWLNRPLFHPDFHEWHFYFFTCQALYLAFKKAKFNRIKIMPDIRVSNDRGNEIMRVLIKILDRFAPALWKSSIIGIAYK